MKYEVEIKATVRKTITVEAETAQEASELAHEEFSILNDGSDEEYTQDTVWVRRKSCK